MLETCVKIVSLYQTQSFRYLLPARKINLIFTGVFLVIAPPLPKIAHTHLWIKGCARRVARSNSLRSSFQSQPGPGRWRWPRVVGHPGQGPLRAFFKVKPPPRCAAGWTHSGEPGQVFFGYSPPLITTKRVSNKSDLPDNLEKCFYLIYSIIGTFPCFPPLDI